jgi:hypothetical protein
MDAGDGQCSSGSGGEQSFNGRGRFIPVTDLRIGCVIAVGLKLSLLFAMQSMMFIAFVARSACMSGKDARCGLARELSLWIELEGTGT